MTVVLTGDVHQWIDSADRAYAAETECALALRYARIAARYGLRITLFFTGLAVIEDAGSIVKLVEAENVEVGGHGWDSFRPPWRYRLLRKLFGSPHGPRSLQARMVRRTCSTIESVSGRKVLSWRNHAYGFNEHTPPVLWEAGVRVWSDEVNPDRAGPYADPSGIMVLPINTTPDHENLYHGGQTIQTVPPDRQLQYRHPDAWREAVVRQADSIVARGGVATILAHPLCMKVADDWRTFDRLCSSLSHHANAWAFEVAPRARD